MCVSLVVCARVVCVRGVFLYFVSRPSSGVRRPWRVRSMEQRSERRGKCPQIFCVVPSRPLLFFSAEVCVYTFFVSAQNDAARAAWCSLLPHAMFEMDVLGRMHFQTFYGTKTLEQVFGGAGSTDDHVFFDGDGAFGSVFSFGWVEKLGLGAEVAHSHAVQWSRAENGRRLKHQVQEEMLTRRTRRLPLSHLAF